MCASLTHNASLHPLVHTSPTWTHFTPHFPPSQHPGWLHYPAAGYPHTLSTLLIHNFHTSPPHSTLAGFTILRPAIPTPCPHCIPTLCPHFPPSQHPGRLHYPATCHPQLVDLGLLLLTLCLGTQVSGGERFHTSTHPSTHPHILPHIHTSFHTSITGGSGPITSHPMHGVSDEGIERGRAWGQTNVNGKGIDGHLHSSGDQPSHLALPHPCWLDPQINLDQ